ncbi:MAG: aminotransferase class I/II-fold pyridoxal phosphate-dependent enzyme [Sedimenticolaceae bacterium]
MHIAQRMGDIAPFRVMEILGRARAMEAQGRDVVHLEIGEPDFVSPQPVIDAAHQALHAGFTHYTPATGLSSLREMLADYYRRQFGESVDPRRILVTPGASGALQLVLGVLVDPGDRVLHTDPGYPCNRHLVSLFGGVPIPLAVSVDTDYAVTESALSAAMTDGAAALMLASPANPTGNLIPLDHLRALNRRLCEHGDAVLICDEIYQGLQYDCPVQTALSLHAENVVVINSFSKFFGMTGWRVGWAVVPDALVEPMERLAQNLFLAAPTLAQHAALAAFSESGMEILEARRQAFQERRDYLYSAIGDLGFVVGPKPAGAFYLYADASRFTDDSLAFCQQLLESAGVAITPGHDFGCYRAAQHVRFAYTTGQERLELGIERLRRFITAGGD